MQNHASGEYIVMAEGCPAISQPFLVSTKLSIELLTIPSYLNLWSGYRQLIFIRPPSFNPTNISDSFLVSFSRIDRGKLERDTLWKV